MSVSYDYSKAQQVEAFVQFLEVLSDPKGLAKLFADIKEARTSAEAAIAAKTKVEEVDAFVARAEADIDKKYSEVEQQMTDITAQAASLKKAQADFNQTQSVTEAKLRERESAVALKETQLTEALKQAEVDAQVLAKKVAEVEAAKKENAALAESLAEKVAAVQKILGN